MNPEKKGNWNLTGDEAFKLNDAVLNMNVLDFWRWHFCDRFDLQDKIAEYIVAKALGKEKADNTGSWTLYDIDYKGKRIEIKETSYYHSWQSDGEKKSRSRTFGITKAHSNYKNTNSELARQNDIYVFCLNTGDTKEESDPLDLSHWEFYIIKTDRINEECGDAKTISLSHLKKLVKPVPYSRIKETVDSLSEE